MSTLAVLGGADGSLGTLRTAREMGLRTLCIDSRGDAPGALAADALVNISTLNVDELAGVLGPMRDLAGVLSPASDVNLPSQYRLAQLLGLPSGLSPDALRMSVDKGFFRDVCDSLGLPGPRYRQGTGEQILRWATDLDFPLMIKPTDSSGSRGVRLVHTSAELPDAVAEAVAFSISGVVIAEEFVAGDQLTVEVIVQDGEVAVLMTSLRTLTPPPDFVTTEHRISADDSADAVLLPMVQALCGATGYRQGSLNLDVFRTPSGEYVLGEAGARLGGNGMAELMVLARGVDATRAAVAMALGRSVDLRATHRRCAAMRVLQAPCAGKLTAIEGLDEVRAMRGVADVVLAVHPGERVEPYTRAGAKLGYVLVGCVDCTGPGCTGIDTILAGVSGTLGFVIEEDG